MLIASEGTNTYFGDGGIDTLQIAGSSVSNSDFDINLEEGSDNFGNISFGIENVNSGAGDDRIFGGGVDNVLNGGFGNDTLLGGGGNDTLTGGAGNDNFGIEGIAGNIEITDFIKGDDQIDVSGIEGVDDFADLADFLIAGDGNLTLTFDLEGDDQLQLLIASEEELDETDFLFG